MDNRELIKKAYEHFNGVWPYLDHLSMVVKIGAKRSDGERYESYVFNKEFFDCDSFLISEWQWVGTKEDFNTYGKSLKEAPAETEAVLGANIWKADGYKVQVKFSEEDSTEDEKWLPAIGQEFEVFYSDEWLTCVLTNENILIQNEDGDWFPEDREYLLENCDFRQAPVENFIEKFLDLCVEHFVEIEGGQEIRGNFSSEESFRKAAKYFYKRGMCFKEDS